MNAPFLDFHITKAAPGMGWGFTVWSGGQLLAASAPGESFPDPGKAMAAAVNRAKASLKPVTQKGDDE